MQRILIAAAALSGAAAVTADAAARHVLAGDAYRLDLAATAARYGLVHAAVLLALACWRRFAPEGAGRFWLALAGWCFVAALVLFCGPLYLAAAGWSLGFGLVPVGGTLFIVGWVALLVSALSPQRAG